MRKRKLLSCLLIGLLSFTLVACGDKPTGGDNGSSGGSTSSGKVDVIKEEAFTTLPEQQLATEYLKEYLKGGDELYQDGIKFKELYWDDKNNPELIEKYNLKCEVGAKHNLIDAYNDNSKLYATTINTLIASKNYNVSDSYSFANKTLMPLVQNYLSDVWMDNKDGDYRLSPEFNNLNPKKHFQKYLKENNIEIADITYPTIANGVERISGATVINVPIKIEGTQDGKGFSKDINVELYFVVTKEIREGSEYKFDDITNFEIMGVNISSDKKDLNGFNYKFDYANALKDFGIE